jgi:glycosyltransferase involved in cell wall biosynthesis
MGKIGYYLRQLVGTIKKIAALRVFLLAGQISNDIAFRTIRFVGRRTAPSQTLIDEKTGVRLHASRVSWNLERMTFGHDFKVPGEAIRRLESDFCELTCAGVRMSAIDEIGFVDDAYGFYHEDADFCYRLRQAGYASAYLPGSRIEHWTSSTLSGEMSGAKLEYLARNKRRFEEKFLGYYVKHADHRSSETNSWNIINRNLHPTLRRYGLVNPDHPELIFSHPGIQPFDYLYTMWETTRLPESWLAHRNAYKLVMTSSRRNGDDLRDAGFGKVHYVPLGVEGDVFHPRGAERRLTERQTFLCFSSNQYRKGLDIMLRAWASFNAKRPGATLPILMGTGILPALPRRADTSRRCGNLQVHTYAAEGIEVHEAVEGTDERDLAAIYRGVDFTVCSSRAEGFGFVVAESLACGTPAIFGNYGATSDFVHEGALLLDGRVTRADYSDKGFDNVGDWWEPDVEQLTQRLVEAHDMDDVSYRALSERGTRLIRAKFSWRATSLAVRAALAADTERSPAVTMPTPQVPLPPSRLRNALVRNIRRVGDFSTHVTNRLEGHGAVAAFR